MALESSMMIALSSVIPSSAVAPSPSRRRIPPLGAALAAASFALIALPGSAAAETVVGVDLNFNDSVIGDEATNGAGVDVFFGPRLDLAILTLTTEISGGFHDFGGDLDPTVYRAMAGGSVGIGVIIRPSVFAHIGVGHLRFDDPFSQDRAGRTNLTADLGAALDFTILPLVDLGIHGSYNVLAGDDDNDPFEWLQAGAHITFVLDGDDT
jgi:hypothetical protein